MIAWPERVVGFLALVEVLILAMFGLSSPTAWTAEWAAAMWWAWRVPVVTLLPLWIVLRVIDGLFAGPARRAKHRVIGFVP